MRNRRRRRAKARGDLWARPHPIMIAPVFITRPWRQASLLLSIFQENLSLRERTPPNPVSGEEEGARKREREKARAPRKRAGKGGTVAAPGAVPRSPSSVFGRSCGAQPKVRPAE
ncbi:hypothetical protein NL676_006883 [Syzygium grande]|nr:hypothetical protein NL676_006883 [Syzygium grande]